MNRYFDERPWSESYNMMSFNPGIPMMYPYQETCNKNNDSKINELESKIDNLQNRVSRLEGNMYPQAVDYNSYPKTTYQNSMNMM